MAIFSASDGTIKLWNVNGLKNVRTWIASTMEVYTLAYCKTTDVLASGSNDQLVKVWDRSLWDGKKKLTIFLKEFKQLKYMF